MTIIRRSALLLSVSGALVACTSAPDLARYADQNPALIPEKVFDGKLKAW